MTQPLDPIALLYDNDGYVELLKRPPQAPARGPAGLMGRQVAGKEFLDASLTHGTWDQLVALVYNQPSVDSLRNYFLTHPANQHRKRHLQLIDGRQFHRHFFPTPPSRLLYVPCPPHPAFAWARQAVGPAAFALCGVTHTLCTPDMVRALCGLLTVPFEPYDALICTSRAVVQMVRAVTDTYADYLRDRHGGDPRLRLRLETIPLGVNPDKFRPPSPEERAAQRRALNVADDEVMVLFVGRLVFHAKAHPFPMYDGIARAAQALGRKVHLVLAGWTDQGTLEHFANGARVLAPNVRVTIVDGTRPEVRTGVWHAADVFTSLSDNIQETFGLVIVEAMASGLPVVASDWNGYRDLVRPGETGLLVPTFMVEDALRDATSRLLGMEELNYDDFLGECSQTVAVDPAAAAEAYALLIGDAELRRRMGQAGRQLVLERFAWQHVIAAYEALWQSQEAERQAHAARASGTQRGPAQYPVPEVSFAGYPTRVLGDGALLEAAADAEQRLETLLRLPLTGYGEKRRAPKVDIFREVLRAAASPCTLAELDDVLRRFDVARSVGRATVAWLLKYGLLRTVGDAPEPEKKKRKKAAIPRRTPKQGPNEPEA